MTHAYTNTHIYKHTYTYSITDYIYIYLNYILRCTEKLYYF